jgi:hypothetical protein
MDDGHARVRMSEVEKHIENTWFAWVGGTQEDSVFYYRIQSPVILIEFDHQRPANLRKFAKDPQCADTAAYSLRGAHTQRQRLWEGPAATALSDAPSRKLRAAPYKGDFDL